MVSYDINIDDICQIARDAGAAIMDIYAGEFAVELKDDNSPLTSADRAAHRLIVDALKQATPRIPILSEEGRDIPYAERAGWKRFWLVDPLDGTKEFIKRNGEFTVNIALVTETFVTAGVVFVPALDKLYWGVRGHGAWLKEGEGRAKPIRVRQADAEAGLTVVMSRSHPSPELQAYLEDLKVTEALPVGSSLKLCVIAEGRADLYPRLGPTMEWDTAAGHAVVEAAGGSVRQVDGQTLRYNKKDLMNPHFIVRGG
jgi:3'(2'), 5'-bisphosphate nucleotidase